MNAVKARLFLWLQYLLPRYLLTRLVYRLSRVREVRMKNAMIRGFVKAFDVDIEEAAARVPDGYTTFNHFFTRALVDGARPIATGNDCLVSPVDGTVSEAGDAVHGRLYQAKGHYYSLSDLLACDLDDASRFDDGLFATIYLAPYNYHRVHVPLAGRLTALRYVPGDLYSVNRATVEQLPNLFARNERLVCHFDSDIGPYALLLVGALNVGSITTPWTGEIRPRRSGMVEALDLHASEYSTDVAKGDLLGWFNMGSTVILLLPRGCCALRDDLAAGLTLRMGESIGTLQAMQQ